jgi:hypothetical protein
MLGVTVFGLLLTPVFYVVLRGMAARRAERRVSDAPPAVAAAHAEATSHA